MRWGRDFTKVCTGGHDHIRLRGYSPSGELWTRVACPYWPGWARSLAKAWRRTLHEFELMKVGPGRATLFVQGGSAQDVATGIFSGASAGGPLPKGKSREGLVTSVASMKQPGGRALPQLAPDGLPPLVHLEASNGWSTPMRCQWRRLERLDMPWSMPWTTLKTQTSRGGKC